MTTVALERRRTGWDVALGALLIFLGFAVLGHTALATAVSVLYLGWCALLGGAAALLSALLMIGRPGFWSTAVTGGMLAVLGLAILRNPAAAAITLTLLAGTLFLATGVIRIVAALQERRDRAVVLLGGLVSTALGLLVLFNLVDASYTLLGILLGVEVLVDGMVMVATGRLRPVRSGSPTKAAVPRRRSSAEVTP